MLLFVYQVINVFYIDKLYEMLVGLRWFVKLKFVYIFVYQRKYNICYMFLSDIKFELIYLYCILQVVKKFKQNDVMYFIVGAVFVLVVLEFEFIGELLVEVFLKVQWFIRNLRN